jgi:hypothetical protein
MNVVNPAALFLAALAAPIIVFYVLKIRLRRVPVSTLLFWQQIFDEKKPRSLWQKLRHLISLLLQLAFVALVVLALADPIFRWQQARARRLVLVVDNSASMNAKDVLPSRLDAAKAEGTKLIDGMRQGDELAIIAAGAQPRVACGPTDHQRSLRSALDSIPAADGPTRVFEAVALARRLLSGSDKIRKVVVLTDGAFDKAGELARQEDVELIAVGTKAGNVGITRLQARRSLLDPIGYEILVEVENASDEPASFRLELDLEGDPVDVVPLDLAAGERTVQVFEKTSADGGRLQASIDRADLLLADNTAWAILPRRARQKVRLVTPGNLFLEKVFEAIPLVDLEVERVAMDAQVLPAPLAQPGGSDGPIIVYHRKVPVVVPAGHVFVIEPEQSGPLWQVGEAIHNPVVAKQDKDSPLMLYIRLDNVIMPEARKLVLKAPAKVIAESAAGDPLYAVLERPAAGKLAVLTVDLDKSDLPLQTAFPIMVTNLMSWFGGARGELREALAAGSVAAVELDPQSGSAGASLSQAGTRQGQSTGDRLERVLVGPDGKEQPIDLPQGAIKVTLGPLDRCGVWSVLARPLEVSGARTNVARSVRRGEVVLDLACNLADRRESDLRPDPGMSERPSNLAAGMAIRPIWYYLLVTAVVLICWEWFLYQRRWID